MWYVNMNAITFTRPIVASNVYRIPSSKPWAAVLEWSWCNLYLSERYHVSYFSARLRTYDCPLYTAKYVISVKTRQLHVYSLTALQTVHICLCKLYWWAYLLLFCTVMHFLRLLQGSCKCLLNKPWCRLVPVMWKPMQEMSLSLKCYRH